MFELYRIQVFKGVTSRLLFIETGVKSVVLSRYMLTLILFSFVLFFLCTLF